MYLCFLVDLWSSANQLLTPDTPDRVIASSDCTEVSLAKLKAFYPKCLMKSHHTPVWELKGNIIIPILQKEETEALKQINNSWDWPVSLQIQYAIISW